MARRPAPPAISPGRFVVEGLDPTGRTGARPFAALLGVVVALALLRALGPWLTDGWTRGHEALAAIPLAVLLVPALGHVLRRLNDLGWSGWWAWALALPWLRWVFLGLLAVAPASQRRRRGDGLARLAGLALAGVVALGLCASLIWTVAPVAAQTMKPSLRPGDLVLLRRAPLALARGDVVAIGGEGRAPRLARVVGLPGDRVAIEEGRPVIDGAPALWAEDGEYVETFARQGPAGVMPICGNGAVGLGAPCRTARWRETLPKGRAAAYPVLDAGLRPLDARPEVVVPEGRLYVLSDHRDAGGDSRLDPAVGGAGLVAAGDVVGRAALVLLAFESARPWDPRGWRPGRLLRGIP